MKYKFEGSDEVKTCDKEAFGNIASIILEHVYGDNAPCNFELIRVDNGVFVLKKKYKEVHVYENKSTPIKKLKRRWHPTKGRKIRKYFKYL